MWEISVSDQLATFLYSLCLGVILCICYDILRALRRAANSGNIAVFLGDVFYFITSAFAVFLFLLARTNGEIRGYVLVSILTGFIASRFTLSRIFVPPLSKLFALFHTAYSFLGLHTLKILLMFGTYFTAFIRFLSKKAKTALKCVKKLLKSATQLLYTKQNNGSVGE